MTKNFDSAVTLLLAHEGGFSNNPSDPGGATKYGITLRSWATYLARQITVDDLKAMTEDEAKKFYLDVYWTPLLLEQFVYQKLATIVLDLSVNCGYPTIIRRLQGIAAVAPADGIMGPNTLAVVNSLDGNYLAFQLARTTAMNYIYHAKTDLSQMEFLAGWIARVMSLLNYLFFNNPE